MICSECYNPTVELKNSKDPKTGFWLNFWFCNECNRRVDPMKSIDETLEDAIRTLAECSEINPGHRTVIKNFSVD